MGQDGEDEADRVSCPRRRSLSLTAELAGRIALSASALPHSPILCGVKAASAALVRSDLGQAGRHRRGGSALSDVITSCF